MDEAHHIRFAAVSYGLYYRRMIPPPPRYDTAAPASSVVLLFVVVVVPRSVYILELFFLMVLVAKSLISPKYTDPLIESASLFTTKYLLRKTEDEDFRKGRGSTMYNHAVWMYQVAYRPWR